MKLYHAAPSPFARKARMTAALRGLADRIERVAVNTMASPAVAESAPA